MSMTFHKDEEKGIHHFRGIDKVSFSDFEQYFSLLYKSLVPITKIFVNLQNAELDLSTNEIETISLGSMKFVKEQNNIQIAIVANDNLTYGLARMYCSLLGKSNILCRAFRNYDEAAKWTGM